MSPLSDCCAFLTLDRGGTILTLTLGSRSPPPSASRSLTRAWNSGYAARQTLC